jgi:mRNA-degrading endonuclease HigB of HigAB toxin-antitoxin module
MDAYRCVFKNYNILNAARCYDDNTPIKVMTNEEEGAIKIYITNDRKKKSANHIYLNQNRNVTNLVDLVESHIDKLFIDFINLHCEYICEITNQNNLKYESIL